MKKKGQAIGIIVVLCIIVLIIALISFFVGEIKNIVFKEDKFCKDRNFESGKYYLYDGKLVCFGWDSDDNHMKEKFDVEEDWYKYSEVEQ